MKEPYGYVVQAGYIGYVNGKKMLFKTEDAYETYISERNEKEEN